MNKEQKYIYHGVPKNMSGSVLYPLNELKNTLPEIAATHAEKYVGREKLLTRTIPLLNCLWNDVLHTLAVHPEEVKTLYREVGFNKAASEVRQYYKIPIDMLDTENIVVYKYNKYQDTDYFENKEQYTPLLSQGEYEKFDITHFDEYATIPHMTKAYFELIQKTPTVGKKTWMQYLFVPHVLYKGSIDTTGLEIIEV